MGKTTRQPNRHGRSSLPGVAWVFRTVSDTTVRCRELAGVRRTVAAKSALVPNWRLVLNDRADIAGMVVPTAVHREAVLWRELLGTPVDCHHVLILL